jgi:cation-transporting ATPase E
MILKYVTWMMVPTSIALIISQLVVKDTDFKRSVARTVGGIVPMIPEGLVLLTSVAFAIGVIRLGRKQCLVQELPAIEGLARVDVVCLDKTGTLTEGGMDVTELRTLDGADEAYVRAVLGALGESDPRPNASLQAIIDTYPDGGDWRCTQALPFSSARKYSGATFSEGDGQSSTWLLGAPDVLLPDGNPVLDEIEDLNQQGLRVLLLSRAHGELDDPDVAGNARATALVVLEPTSPTRTSTPRSSPATTPSRSAPWRASSACPAPTGPSTPAACPPSATRWRRSSTRGPSSGASRRSRNATWSARSRHTDTPSP